LPDPRWIDGEITGHRVVAHFLNPAIELKHQFNIIALDEYSVPDGGWGACPQPSATATSNSDASEHSSGGSTTSGGVGTTRQHLTTTTSVAGEPSDAASVVPMLAMLAFATLLTMV
jgi:hypothetical protein